jgi:DNA-directed RNA polymerase II subunit RPB2
MISEQQTWEILGDYFNKKGFVTHQIESFNEFIQNGISKVISEEPDIKIVSDDPKNFKTYTVSIDDLYIPKPTVIEETREIRELFPYEARLRDLTYDSPLYVNIVETLETEDDIEITKHNRILLGRIP